MRPAGSGKTSPDVAAPVLSIMTLIPPTSRNHKLPLGADSGRASPQKVLCCRKTALPCQAIGVDGASVIEVMEKLLTF